MSFECELTPFPKIVGDASPYPLCRNNTSILLFDVKIFAIRLYKKNPDGSVVLINNDSAIKSAITGLSSSQKQNLEAALIHQEEPMCANDLESIRRRFSTLKQIREYFKKINIAFCGNSLFGPTENDVAQWIMDPNSGYLDLVYKLIYLLENNLVPNPNVKGIIRLTTINAAYQNVLNRGYNQPSQKHSIFIIKLIYEELCDRTGG